MLQSKKRIRKKILEYHSIRCHLSYIFCFAIFTRAENTTSAHESISLPYTVQTEPDGCVRFFHAY